MTELTLKFPETPQVGEMVKVNGKIDRISEIRFCFYVDTKNSIINNTIILGEEDIDIYLENHNQHSDYGFQPCGIKKLTDEDKVKFL